MGAGSIISLGTGYTVILPLGCTNGKSNPDTEDDDYWDSEDDGHWDSEDDGHWDSEDDA